MFEKYNKYFIIIGIVVLIALAAVLVPRGSDYTSDDPNASQNEAESLVEVSEDELDTLKEEADKVSGLKSENLSLFEKVEALNGIIWNRDGSIAELEDEVESKSKELAELLSDKNALSGEVAELQTSLAHAQAGLTAAQSARDNWKQKYCESIEGMFTSECGYESPNVRSEVNREIKQARETLNRIRLLRTVRATR